MSLESDVLAWLHKLNIEPVDVGEQPAESLRKQIAGLVAEESKELVAAMKQGHNPDKVMKEVADVIFVATQVAVLYGCIDFDPIWKAVVDDNMKKDVNDRTPEGKVRKPPGYKPPDIALIMSQLKQGKTNE
jgi:phosphoribosyl-ATP pyrophosphohydrolase